MGLKCKFNLLTASSWLALIAKEDWSWNCWVLNTNSIEWFYVVIFFSWDEESYFQGKYHLYLVHKMSIKKKKKKSEFIWARKNLHVVDFIFWSIRKCMLKGGRTAWIWTKGRLLISTRQSRRRAAWRCVKAAGTGCVNECDRRQKRNSNSPNICMW